LAASTASTSTDLAVERTRLAHDRTLMAWVRTAASLISFGFTIYKFFQYMREQGQPVRERLFGPREFALSLIALGLVGLVLATIQNRRGMKVLRKHYPQDVPYSLVTVLGGMIGLLGCVTFLAVVFKQ
jgi:putative membrane protein